MFCVVCIIYRIARGFSLKNKRPLALSLCVVVVLCFAFDQRFSLVLSPFTSVYYTRVRSFVLCEAFRAPFFFQFLTGKKRKDLSA